MTKSGSHSSQRTTHPKTEAKPADEIKSELDKADESGAESTDATTTPDEVTELRSQLKGAQDAHYDLAKDHLALKDEHDQLKTSHAAELAALKSEHAAALEGLKAEHAHATKAAALKASEHDAEQLKSNETALAAFDERCEAAQAHVPSCECVGEARGPF